MQRTASRETVKQMLMYPEAMYVDEDGEECDPDKCESARWENGEQAMSAEQADAAINAHVDILDHGIRMRSNDWYVADRIREAMSK